MIEQIPTSSPLINEQMGKELTAVFGKLTKDVTLKAIVDPDSDKGRELTAFLGTIAALSPRIKLEVYTTQEARFAPELDTAYLPVTGLYGEGGYSGAAFHGVPGGKEINSFVIAVYNLAGPGQELSRWTLRKIQKLDQKTNIKICVSLACHYCPQVVMACQRMAIENPCIEAEMIDANLYPELVEKYKIQRVPLTIINDTEVHVGPKTIEEMVDIVKKSKK